MALKMMHVLSYFKMECAISEVK